MATNSAIKNAWVTVSGIFGLGLLIFLYMIIFGNLSGNTGFASGTAGYNNTEAVIGNLTSGGLSFVTFSPTLLIMAGVVLLVGIVFSVIKGVQASKASGNFN